MKKLSLPLLACALVGLVALFLPQSAGPSVFGMFSALAPFRGALIVAAFGVPAFVAVLGLTRTAQPWHASATLAGFAVATVMLEVWSMVMHLRDLSIPMLLLFGATLLGAFFAIVGFAKQQEQA